MNYKKFISFDQEIADEVFEFIFSYCDKIEYLSEYQYGYLDDVPFLEGTRLSDLVPAFLSRREGDSWGMVGTLYTFSLSKEAQEIIKEAGVYASLRADPYILQNATLYRGEKAVFSVCSHEGYDFYEDEFKEDLGRVCCRAMEKTDACRSAEEAYSRTATRKNRAREKNILRAVANYVAQDSGAVIYFTPPEECNYARFLKLSELYFSPRIRQKLKMAKRFSDLHPQGYAKTLEEIANFQGVPRFEEGELYSEMQKELFYLSYVEEKNGNNS